MRRILKRMLLLLGINIMFRALLFSVIFAITSQAYAADEKIVLAGGCFWGMEAVYRHVNGVKEVMPGYAGGEADTAHYEMVGTGKTGHAEAVEVIYDPAQINLEQILKIYFLAAHNPTELNYQTPDHGTQYRSAIFYSDEDQKKAAQDMIGKLTNNKAFSKPIVTTLEPLKQFYPAEEYHRNYAALNPYRPYIIMYDKPRVQNVKQYFPELYRDK